MKKLLLTIFLLSTPLSNVAFSNAAMPGFWNIGTGQVFTPSFKEEEKYSEKIKMESEVVKVLLFKGFAVVKGEYNMLNLSDKDIKIHVGYPDHGVFRNEKVSNIIFKELDNLTVKVDDELKEIKLSKDDNKNAKWFIWNNDFKAKKITKIQVYYMIDNHFSSLRKGYNREDGNGFSYIIESGKIWADKIGKGNILIKLEDGLEYENILGVLPEKTLTFSKENKTIEYSFSNLEPKDSDNVLVRYENFTDENFDYNKIKNDYKKYYSLIDSISFDINSKDKEVIEKSDFKVKDKIGFIIITILFLSLLAFLFILSFFVSKVKRKKKN
jgi:hypothetical protein